MTAPRTPTRLRLAVRWATGVAVIAAVILGVAALQPGPRADDPDSSSESGAFLARRATEVLESGDETGALSFAERALAVDPGNKAAVSVADEVERRRSSGSEGTEPPPGGDASGGGAGPQSDEAFLSDIGNLAALLPETFADYALGSAVELDGEVSLSATPDNAGARVQRIVWAVHDAGTRDGAAAFVSKTSEVLYSKDVSSAVIDGATAYVGTDGTRYASAVYTRGRYVFEVLVSGTDGAPAGYRDVAVAAAKAFADTPAH